MQTPKGYSMDTQWVEFSILISNYIVFLVVWNLESTWKVPALAPAPTYLAGILGGKQITVHSSSCAQ